MVYLKGRIITNGKSFKRMGDFEYIKKNLERIQNEICGRATLVCVSKSASDDELINLVRLGVSDIAENRPQELSRRHELLKSAGLSVNMHQIGTLQRNKVKLVVPFCKTIQSLDSVRLADEISKCARKQGRTVDVLVEINSAREEQKSGIMPEELSAFLDYVEGLESVSVCGLMTMGPVCESPEELRPYFKETKRLFDENISRFGKSPILSMGMSESYLTAIEEGANLVRIGRALFVK